MKKIEFLSRFLSQGRYSRDEETATSALSSPIPPSDAPIVPRAQKSMRLIRTFPIDSSNTDARALQNVLDEIMRKSEVYLELKVSKHVTSQSSMLICCSNISIDIFFLPIEI